MDSTTNTNTNNEHVFLGPNQRRRFKVLYSKNTSNMTYTWEVILNENKLFFKIGFKTLANYFMSSSWCMNDSMPTIAVHV